MEVAQSRETLRSGDNNGGVDVGNFTYKKKGFQIEATKIIGKTLFTNLKGGRGEKKEETVKFQ